MPPPGAIARPGEPNPCTARPASRGRPPRSSSSAVLGLVAAHRLRVGRVGAHVDAALPAALQRIGDTKLHAADPLDLEQTVDINELFSIVKARKLPLWAPRLSDTPAAGTVAMRLLHPPGETDDFDWTNLLASASDDALESHGFNSDARRALRAGDWQAALEARAAHVLRIVSELVSQRARWGESDRPSLEYLAVDSTQP